MIKCSKFGFEDTEFYHNINKKIAMGFLDFLFGNKNNEIKSYIEKGAIILDVRTDDEYNAGAIKNSKHIPLGDLHNQIDTVKALNTPLIVCCRSGVRSAKATAILNKNNIDAINGGGWKSLESQL